MSHNSSVKTILILAANPTDTARLRLDKEVRSIDNGLSSARNREQFRLVQKWAVRSRDFYLAILEHQPTIVHFCGHGAGVDGIVLEDETGLSSPVDKEALAKFFKLFALRGVECVLLNACYSEEQAQAISQYIKYVIGMTQAIADSSAIDFAVAFYDALGAGETVEFAYDLGCAQLARMGEHHTPVLKKTAIHPSDIQFVAGDIPPNPYQGLSAFGEKDAEFFFGREKVTENLFEIAHKQPLIAVIGASGSGKSSVVFAGLIPKLREEGIWLIEWFRPKSQPFDELALALVRQLEPDINKVERAIQVGRLAESLKKGEVKLHQVASQILENQLNKRLLLVIDQFEELYTQYQNKEEQQHFIDTLLLAVNQKSITLVFTLRADFYGYVLSYRPFSDALEQFAHKPVGLMSREELKTAIEQPALKLNVQLQAHLAQRILEDVGQEPGNLPLLEFALTQLWSKQYNHELTHKAYDEIGGVKQGLIKHSEQVYLRLNESQKQHSQRIFLSLVRLGEGTEDTRRVATREEVGNNNWDLVTYLAGSEARLVVTGRNDKSGEETVEVVHEALIREWGRLRGWVNENRERLIQKRKIEAAALEWKQKNKSKDYLWQGKPLKDAQVFLKDQTVSFALSDLASEFVQKSIRHRRNNRLKSIGFGFIPIVALTVFLGFTLERQMQITRHWGIVNDAKEQKDSPARISALQELVKLGVPLNNITLSAANLSGANLRGANLRDANLFNANFSSANLFDADLRSANLSSANLSSADLLGVNLSSANLSSANLSSASLSFANLFDTNLSSTDFSSANLLGADLTSANLSSANLSSANLENAELGCIVISKVEKCTDFRGAKNLTPEQVKKAKNWEKAIYDREFRKQLGLPPQSTKAILPVYLAPHNTLARITPIYKFGIFMKRVKIVAI